MSDKPATPEENLKAILESPSYILAEEDVAFLKRDELRPARLELELLKPELTFQEHDIHSTVVLFGGTRILEAARADERIQELEKELEGDPGNPEIEGRLAVARRIRAKSPYYDVARDFARLVSSRCQIEGRRTNVIVTGGGPGIMEAGNRGAFEAGAKSIGLNITIPREQVPNAYITPELCFQFHYFALRKMHFLMRARAMVAFPGGFGTMDELFESLTLIQTGKMKPIPIVLVGREFWTKAVNWRFFVDEGTIAPHDLALFSFADTPEEIWAAIDARPEETSRPG
jgi:uncharacterized protein (TIGR00730 family)